jgi:hypothetical protein
MRLLPKSGPMSFFSIDLLQGHFTWRGKLESMMRWWFLSWRDKGHHER